MLVQYLSGTADYLTERTKEDILEDRKTTFINFKTKKAHAVRDERLAPYVGFLHCAYRYRGKPNYRDAIYLTYGTYPQDVRQFLDDLAGVSRFLFACALAFVQQRCGSSVVHQFARDLEEHLRDFNSVPPDFQSLVRQL